MMTQLGERIRKIRKLCNMSQGDFAKTLGVHRGHISNLETGAAVPSEQLIKFICQYYGVREEWLRDGSGSIEPRSIRLKLEEGKAETFAPFDGYYQVVKKGRLLSILHSLAEINTAILPHEEWENSPYKKWGNKKPKKTKIIPISETSETDLIEWEISERKWDTLIHDFLKRLPIELDEIKRYIDSNLADDTRLSTDVERSVINLLRSMDTDSLKDFYLFLATKADRLDEKRRSALKKDISTLKKAAR